MDSIAAGELPQADGISWKYRNSIEFPKTDHELSGHGRGGLGRETRDVRIPFACTALEGNSRYGCYESEWVGEMVSGLFAGSNS